MKIADYISKSIQEYPSLYKDINYERSKLKVLCHIFFTNGNGLEMAETENPLEGGYVVDPKYKKDKKFDEWTRLKDKPYGKETYKPLPDDYFESMVYYVYSSGNRPKEVIHKKTTYDDKVLFVYDKPKNYFEKPTLYEAKSTHEFSPYPISKGFCISSNIFHEDLFLQQDWMDELLILCKRTLEYFNDENQYKENTYYPDDRSVYSDLVHFKETFKKEGVKGLKNLRKIWGYAPKDTVPTKAEIKERKNGSWEKFHKEQISFLKKFLKKYDKQKTITV